MLYQLLKADAVAFNRRVNEVGINSHKPLLRQIECGTVTARQVEAEYGKFNDSFLKMALNGGRIGHHGTAGDIGIILHKGGDYLLKK